ncbi:MAG TPA: hypothetical protein VK654_11600 [Nitrospirota bacterium]|nr:hypothetical protein [Nitrospirota bacterium]
MFDTVSPFFLREDEGQAYPLHEFVEMNCPNIGVNGMLSSASRMISIIM